MRRRTADDRGFVLVAAVWLLLLAGAIVAVLMLRGIGAAKSADADAVRLRTELDRNSIVQGVVADLAINGRRSYWSRMPARTNVLVRGRPVVIEVTSEAGRTDLNSVDLARLDQALAGLQVPTEDRARLQAELARRRARGEPLGSWAAVVSVLGQVEAGKIESLGLLDRVTIYGGGGAGSLLINPAAHVGTPGNLDMLAGASAAARDNAPIRIRTGLDDVRSGAAIFDIAGQGNRGYMIRN